MAYDVHMATSTPLPSDIDWTAPAADLSDELILWWCEFHNVDDDDTQLATAERWATTMIERYAE